MIICEECFSYNKMNNYCEDLEWFVDKDVVSKGCNWFVNKNKKDYMEKKYKIYLDTSVISHLYQNDAPEKMNETLALWEKIKNDAYDVYLSDITIGEIDECSEEKKNKLFEYIKHIRYTRLSISDTSISLGDKIIQLGILHEKSRDDANHIGIAIANGCNFIISWNFKHMVNVKTVNGVRAITNLTGFNPIDLVTPTYFLGEDN